LRGLFITGTDTEVGKTVLAAAIVAALRSRGVDAGALKPVITGLDQPRETSLPPDHELIAKAAGCAPDDAVVFGFGPACSPHLAAELAGAPLDIAALLNAINATGDAHELLIVEGVGGLLVPLRGDYDVRRLAGDAGLPLLIAARPGLGTINHTLLSLEAARAGRLEVLAVVLTPWAQDPGEIERSNRATIERLGEVEVAVLPEVTDTTPASLAAAAAELPLGRWLGLELR
jgi:dethiobiotin synthetase